MRERRQTERMRERPRRMREEEREGKPNVDADEQRQGKQVGRQTISERLGKQEPQLNKTEHCNENIATGDWRVNTNRGKQDAQNTSTVCEREIKRSPKTRKERNKNDKERVVSPVRRKTTNSMMNKQSVRQATTRHGVACLGKPPEKRRCESRGDCNVRSLCRRQKQKTIGRHTGTRRKEGDLQVHPHRCLERRSRTPARRETSDVDDGTVDATPAGLSGASEVDLQLSEALTHQRLLQTVRHFLKCSGESPLRVVGARLLQVHIDVLREGDHFLEQF